MMPLCECGCGEAVTVNQRTRRPNRFITGHNSRVAPARATLRHGMSESITYNSWSSMLARCRYPSQPSYPSYGGRGITVCGRWEIFDNFLADMGERPEGTTLDRVDNDGDYEPSNCRWATPAQQARKRSTTKLTPELVARIRAASGRRQKAIATEFGISPSTVSLIRSGKRWTDNQPTPKVNKEHAK